ncbi:hypothetical protein C8J55DRAFT_545502 [Lentinula edodes]|uniref:Uncharacterized protein n=1 Tax=Lentinula lateritia TaxID=40482 RepID=A0A9W9B1Y7_9AGAR|nr:hypothetical protein C8J55DRAFT_545502 [Lentinula edodes]
MFNFINGHVNVRWIRNGKADMDMFQTCHRKWNLVRYNMSRSEYANDSAQFLEMKRWPDVRVKSNTLCRFGELRMRSFLPVPSSPRSKAVKAMWRGSRRDRSKQQLIKFQAMDKYFHHELQRQLSETAPAKKSFALHFERIIPLKLYWHIPKSYWGIDLSRNVTKREHIGSYLLRGSFTVFKVVVGRDGYYRHWAPEEIETCSAYKVAQSLNDFQ